jgi:hypothetical protein
VCQKFLDILLIVHWLLLVFSFHDKEATRPVLQIENRRVKTEKGNNDLITILNMLFSRKLVTHIFSGETIYCNSIGVQESPAQYTHKYIHSDPIHNTQYIANEEM